MTACSSQTGSSALPIQATRLSQPSAGYETIRSFKGGTFGIGPVGRLALVHGSLYGVTDSGGAPLSGNLCCGTVFRAQKSGRGKLLYRFYGSGGVEPSSVMALGGALYVTTALGGLRGSYGMGYGTVFSFSVSGAGRLLYRFGGSPDGAVPIGTLSAVNGVFYGTTEEGGAHGAGTVYEISTSGVESVLYSFKGGLDGSSPRAGLTYFNGAFYGVTTRGGVQGCGARGCGTLFRIDTTGAEEVLYAFKGGSSGYFPTGTLVVAHGKLYGTTSDSADFGNGCGTGGCGTIFEATTSGNVRILHHFGGGPSDGADPTAGLTYFQGVLYGTTAGGGNSGCDTSYAFDGCGTVFSVTNSGQEHVLHVFGGTPDGGIPVGGLLAVKDALYGTTYSGGASDSGTIFKLSP